MGKETVLKWWPIGLIIIVLFFAFFRLGSWAFIDYDEATYARVFHESFQRGDFIKLTKGGAPWLEKPPLYFWLSWPFAYFLRENEFSLRLVSALCIILALVMTWLLTLELSQKRYLAYTAVSIMATAGLLWEGGRQMRMDVPVMAFLLVSIYGFIRGLRQNTWFLLYGLGLGLAVLMKSIVGFLVMPIIVIYALVYNRWSWLRSFMFWTGNVLAFAIIAPWHVYQFYIHKDVFVNGYLKYHLVQRFLEPIIGMQPWYYFFQTIFKTTQPWFVVFIILVAVFIWITHFSVRKYPAEYLSLLSFVSIFLIFQLSQTKLLYYLVPVIPFMAMFIASAGDSIVKYFNLEFARVYYFSFFIIGFVMSMLLAFDPKPRNAFGWPMAGFSKHVVAEEERAMGGFTKKHHLPVYMDGWNLHETLRYYGDDPQLISLTR